MTFCTILVWSAEHRRPGLDISCNVIHDKNIKIATFIFLYLFIFFLIFFALSKLNDAESASLSTHAREILSISRMDFSSSSFDNVTGFDHPIVPNIIHYVRFRKHELDFVEFVCIMSALINHRPDRVMIHCDPCDSERRGKYWRMLTERSTTLAPIELSPFQEPTHVFGKSLSSVYHASDIARISVLAKYGGIFLDGDVYVVKSLKSFLKYEFTLGWPENEYIGTQVLIAHPDARFLTRWLEGYKYYKPFMWYYNAGQLPTEDVLIPAPHLVHRVPRLFGVHYMIDELYKKRWKGWTDFYTIHLLSRHREYLDKESTIESFDEINVQNYPFTFGEMARRILLNASLIDIR